MSISFQHDLMIAEVAYEPSPFFKITYPEKDGTGNQIRERKNM